MLGNCDTVAHLDPPHTHENDIIWRDDQVKIFENTFCVDKVKTFNWPGEIFMIGAYLIGKLH